MQHKLDLIIRNGRIIDGTGNPWYRADVAIAQGRIVKIGRLGKVKTSNEIDACDNVVSPGFIELHSHADFVVPGSNHLEILSPLLLQGITTLIAGNCGFSPAPINDKWKDLLIDYTEPFSAKGLEWTWNSVGDFLSEIGKRGVGINIGQIVGHSAVRNAVMGFERRAATPSEVDKMQGLLERSLEDGAYGLSIGLLYAPSTYAEREEFVALGKVLAAHDGLFTAHLRAYSEQLLSCIRDFAATGRQAGCKVHVSHLHGLGKNNWRLIPEALKLFDELREEGLDITFDVFGYIAGGSTITVLYPPWSLEGGTDKLLERLNQPEFRKRIKAEMEGEIMPDLSATDAWLDNIVRNVGWENIYIMTVTTEENKPVEGMTVAQISRQWETTPFEAFVKITLQERGDALFNYVGASGDLEDDTAVQQMVRHPYGPIVTDAVITGRGKTMPYGYNMFPRLLGHYARDLKIISLEEAVRKITSAPALRIGIRDRGLLLEGYCADITIFDSERIAGRASISKPDLKPEGINYVLINGHMIVKDGQIDTKHFAGHVLRKYS